MIRYEFIEATKDDIEAVGFLPGLDIDKEMVWYFRAGDFHVRVMKGKIVKLDRGI